MTTRLADDRGNAGAASATMLGIALLGNLPTLRARPARALRSLQARPHPRRFDGGGVTIVFHPTRV